MADEVEEIKQRLDIVDFIAGYLTLKKAGSNYKALCPFHSEKTPSFMVSKDKQIFKCFGCSEGGDLFDFVMKMEGLAFGDALKLLANKAGVKLEFQPRRPDEQPSIKTKLYQINNLTAGLYHKILLEHPVGKKAMDYLINDRHLSKETIENFKLGYAPNKWDFVFNFLVKKGFKDNEINQAGLLVAKESRGFYDRFRGRIMFPINDLMGNVVGFSGRVVEDKEGKEEREGVPKYINTSDSPIFHKSSILYGLDKAKLYIKKVNFAVLVEGQMDVIGSHQAGVPIAVASLGTSTTSDHLVILSRYTPNIILAFDQDEAGLKAIKEAILKALALALNIKVVFFSGFKDPGELALKDKTAWLEALKKSKTAIDWHFDLAFSQEKEPYNAEAKKRIAAKILAVLKIIQNPIEQAHYVTELALKLKVADKTIWQALEKIKEEKPELPSSLKPKSESKLTPLEKLRGLFWVYPQIAPEFKNHPLCKKVCEGYNNTEITAKKRALIEFQIQKETAQLDLEEVKKEVNEILSRFNLLQKEKLKEEYALKMKEAEQKGDKATVKTLLAELQSKI